MSAARGPAAFVAVCLGATWATAAAAYAIAADFVPARLLGASLWYVALLGWQPFAALALAQRLDAATRADPGARPATARFLAIAIVVPVALIVIAATVDLVALSDDHHREPVGPGGAQAVRAVIEFAATLALLWTQALVEEVAWRGYLLPGLMRSIGAWPGLVLHGVLWGACYAPALALAGGIERAAAGMVACTLAGLLLGWLRLASASVVASGAANATLTLCAGLPFVLHGATSPWSAIVEPIGWLLMGAVIAVLALHRGARRAIAFPERHLPDHLN